LKGHFLPFGHFKANPGRGATLLAGDAAGLVDPITGEGIAYAIKSGHLAAEAAARAIAIGRPETAFQGYKKALRPIHRNLRIARVMRQLVFSGRYKDAFFERMGRSGRLRYDYLEVLAGNIEYPQLLLKTGLRIPNFLLRGLRARP
jgi:flavin-dependent dehydrogenase